MDGEENTKSHETHALGDVVFDAQASEIKTSSGETLRLRPQTGRVLALLAEHPGEAMTKTAIMDAVWGDTFVTDDSLVQCISELRKAFAAVRSVAIETIPKTGYRLVLSTAATPDGPAPVRPRSRVYLAGAAAICIALLAGLFWFLRPTAPPAEAHSVAVLPFVNMSGEEEQDYFADGISEDLIVSLSRLPDLEVISRGASFTYRSRETDIRDVAAVLGADVIVDGSVRRAGDSLRISAQLVDSKTGRNLWADRYEGAPEDVFAFQEAVLEQLAKALSVRLSASERARLGVHGTRDVAAHDAYLRGVSLEHVFTPGSNEAAEAALLDALRRDPGFAMAHAHLAQVLSYRVENRWSGTPAQDVERALAAAQRAIEIDPELPYAHFSLGRLYSRHFLSDMAQAETHFQRAIELNPNYVDARVFLAVILIFDGRSAEALPLVDEAMRRHPLPPFWYYQAEGMAQYFLGNYEAAVEALTTAAEQNPNAPYPLRFLMAAYGQLGQPDEADWIAMEYESLGREATISALMDTAAISDDAARAKFREGFEKAGLPNE